MPILGTSLIIAFSSKNDFAGKLLSSKPLVGLGLVSYSFYLWHFPIFAFARIDNQALSNYDKLEYISLALFLSVASFFIVEKPFRNKKIIKPRLFLVVIGLATITTATWSFILIKSKGFPERFEIIEYKIGNLAEKPWGKYKKDGENCYQRLTDFCSERQENGMIEVLSFGDSTSAAFSYALAEKTKGLFNFTVINTGGCIFVLGSERYDKDGNIHPWCNSKIQKSRLDALPEKPSIIILSGRFDWHLSQFKTDPAYLDGKVMPVVSKTSLSLADNLRNTIDNLLSEGHYLVIVYPLPTFDSNPLETALSFLENGVKPEYRQLPKQSRVEHEKMTVSSRDIFDSYVSSRIFRVFPTEIFCDDVFCYSGDDEQLNFYDKVHTNDNGSELLATEIFKEIQKAAYDIKTSKYQYHK